MVSTQDFNQDLEHISYISYIMLPYKKDNTCSDITSITATTATVCDRVLCLSEFLYWLMYRLISL